MPLQLKKKEVFCFRMFNLNTMFSGVDLLWKIKFIYIFINNSSLNNLPFWPKGWTQNPSHIIIGQWRMGTMCPSCATPWPGQKKVDKEASLVVQWLRIRLPIQGTWVRALVQEDPTCCGATKPVHHNYWACALEPTSHNYWSPRA